MTELRHPPPFCTQKRRLTQPATTPFSEGSDVDSRPMIPDWHMLFSREGGYATSFSLMAMFPDSRLASRKYGVRFTAGSLNGTSATQSFRSDDNFEDAVSYTRSDRVSRKIYYGKLSNFKHIHRRQATFLAWVFQIAFTRPPGYTPCRVRSRSGCSVWFRSRRS
jgi:hypothetical protein